MALTLVCVIIRCWQRPGARQTSSGQQLTRPRDITTPPSFIYRCIFGAIDKIRTWYAGIYDHWEYTRVSWAAIACTGILIVNNIPEVKVAVTK